MTTDVVVDPSIAGNSGAGTLGDPYGDIAWAISQVAWPADGVHMHVKMGTDEILTQALNLDLTAASWVPDIDQPLIIEGYNTALYDLRDTQSRAGISGAGSFSIIDGSSLDFVTIMNMHLHNCGAADIIDLNNYISLINCELDNTTASAARVDVAANVVGCFIHDIGNLGVEILGGVVRGCKFTNEGTKEMNYCVNPLGSTNIVDNLFDVDGATICTKPWIASYVNGNSAYGGGGTGAFMVMAGPTIHLLEVVNNVVEGFSGVGGIGFDIDQGTVALFDANSCYDCETEYVETGDISINGENETLVSTPFADAAGGDFDLNAVGSVIEGRKPAIFPS